MGSEQKTAGGIIIPDTAQKADAGEVIAVGAGARDETGNCTRRQIRGYRAVW